VENIVHHTVQAYNQGGKPGTIEPPRNFQDHILLVGTTSYNHFALSRNYQLVAALVRLFFDHCRPTQRMWGI